MKILITFLSILFVCTISAQIRSNNTVDNTISGQSAFLDASAQTFSNSVNNGKGLVFPRTDLTTFTFNPANGNFLGYPTGFDGMIVYNTATGTTPASGSGIGSQDVLPGFYYFENIGSAGPTGTGEWVPMDTDTDTRGETIIDDSSVGDVNINESTTIINGTAERVVRLPGTTNGSTTEIDLDTNILPANAVDELREARVYDQSTGELLLIASGRYDAATNVMVTGDGMVNKLLPAGTYTVELFYLPVVAP